ncbi:MAG: FtsX-like permease family protein, partial [Chitinophagaceae bacterium]|nr:FtsX-like permease family protein [Chitinophagaceae bacterium]
AGRITRVTMEYSNSGTVNKTAVTGTKTGPQLKRTFPQIESFTRVIKYPRSVANGIKVFNEKNLLYADADFFNIFSFDMRRGNPATVLASPYKMVLTENTAKKYFGSTDPVGKTLRINDLQDYEITGIVADPPINSQIQFDMVVSFTSLGVSKTEEWFSANYITYVLLHDGTPVNSVEKPVKDYMLHVNKDELHSEGSNYLTYNLEPLLRVHLHSALDGLEPNGNITYIYVLGIVAVLILLIACVNYTNLATAQSIGRSTEIGVRKVLGAGRSQLLKQFLGESFILTLFALMLAIAVSLLLLPLFNSVTGKTFAASLLFRPVPLISFLLLGIIISFLAGAYPAFILSNSGLVNILKSGVRVSSSSGGLRKSLIVFQFVISVFLVIATIIVIKQVSFIQHKELGYDREQVVVLPVDYKMHSIYDPLKKAMALNPGVLSVTGAYEDPTFIEWGDGVTADDGKGKKELSVTAIPVDIDFMKTMGMHLVAGRDFNNNDFLPEDTTNDYKNYRSSFILNEKAARDLGWTPEEAIGKTIQRGGPGVITGVVKDFNFESLHSPIGPLVIFLDTSLVRQLFVKVKGQNIAGTLSSLERTWKDRIAYRPFDYHFLDEDFNKLYQAEQRTANLFALFSGLAIALACLGLFALAAFTTVQRTKEIGIRKILGANVTNITVLIARQFILLVLIGILIASPLAWWAGKTWLQDFAYRINISGWIFITAGLLAIVIALVTVSYHAVRASLVNPVKSLRTE